MTYINIGRSRYITYAFSSATFETHFSTKNISTTEISHLLNFQETLNKSHREKSHNGSSIAQIAQLRNLKSIYYGCALIFFQQMAGFNAVLFYSEAIFKKSSSTFSSSFATIICGLVMLCTAIVVPFMGKLFRIKNILYFSASGCFFFLVSDSKIQ